nr:hypothetical protein [uncultured Capnocytophaga sp.]
MKRYSFFILVFCLILVACSDGKLSSSRAKELIEDSLEAKPLYETAHFSLGEVKYRTQKDGDKIKQLKKLEEDDYISIEELKVKKKWLSNDSVWVVNIKCTDKALPFITELKENRAKVKTIEYILTEEIQIEQKNEKVATIIATLQKKETPFGFLSKKNNLQDYIQKKFKAKYQEKEWILTK